MQLHRTLLELQAQDAPQQATPAMGEIGGRLSMSSAQSTHRSEQRRQRARSAGALGGTSVQLYKALVARRGEEQHEGAREQPSWHAESVEQTLAELGSDAVRGLSSDQVSAKLRRFGPNVLPRGPQRSLGLVFLSQFANPLIYLLFGAAGIALVLGHLSDALVIFVVVLLNAVIGAFQEGKAERSLQALLRLTATKTRVIRDCQQLVIDSQQLVPGDLVLLEAGDLVTADARVVESAALQVAEAALTGESVPVSKSPSPVSEPTALADRTSMVYAGTHVTTGRAHAVLVATAEQTQIGQLAALTRSAPEVRTPLERRVAQFGQWLTIAAAIMLVLINIIGYWHGLPIGETLMVGISQLVGMVPEGLPAAMTIALAVGVQRMARRFAVVRKLAAVETLGSTTVICTDKTGTLTKNEMTVTALWLPGQQVVNVTGVGYAPEGALLQDGQPLQGNSNQPLGVLLEACVLCNDSYLQQVDGPEGYEGLGDPTEVALLSLALKAGLVPEAIRERCPRLAEVPFDSETKLMATEHGTPGASYVLFKGAPEVVLEWCSRVRVEGELRVIDEHAKSEWHDRANAMAGEALRVLAVAKVDGGSLGQGEAFAALRGKGELLGLVGQIDPPRDHVQEAVSRCRQAGIRPVMVTGDHLITGSAIARKLGIATENSSSIDGPELERLSDSELAARIDGVSVFARVHPAQKLRIVQAYQARNEVVAMTGDGVNDAPALVTANVGIAMGRTGTEVAKEAAKVVIGDDNFSTIVVAIEEGRIVYRNIKKVILYLFSTSVAAVLVLFIALAVGFPPPLAAVQILWINLVTESMVTVTLIMEPAEGDEMRRPPISPDEPLLDRSLLGRMAVMTPAMFVSTFGWFSYRLLAGAPFAEVQTETFTVLAACQWFNVLNCRSQTRSVLGLSLLRNPWLIGGLAAGMALQALVVFFEPLAHVFHTVPIGAGRIGAIAGVASLVLWAEELRKWISRR